METKLFRRVKGGRVQVLTGSQCVRRCDQEGCSQRSSDESSMGVDVEFHRHSQGTPLCPGILRPQTRQRFPETAPHTFCPDRGAYLTVRGFEQVEVCVRGHQMEDRTLWVVLTTRQSWLSDSARFSKQCHLSIMSLLGCPC